MICVAVNIKAGKPAWIKARPLNEGETFGEPVIGEPFLACGLSTSPVQESEEIENGLQVRTENSLYHFLILDEDALQALCGGSGLDPSARLDDLRYWGDAPQLDWVRLVEHLRRAK